jgi:acyl dehydratase
MAVSSKFILEQGPVLKELGRTALTTMKQGFVKPSGTVPSTPGPEFRQVLPPRSKELVKTYVKHVGGDPSRYKNTIPAHLFPQWGFALASKTLTGIPYPLVKVMNGGCRLEINGDIPNDKHLIVSARLENIDDNGSRAVLHQRITTGTVEQPDAVVANLFAIVPLSNKGKPKGPKKPKACVPENAQELKYWRIGPKAGLDFAKLTGDFNPIHWIPVHAKAFGFKNTILHGFSTMARAMEGLNSTRFSDGSSIGMFDAQFTRPLVLPGDAGLYIEGEDKVYVGNAAGGAAYMVGTYQAR